MPHPWIFRSGLSTSTKVLIVAAVVAGVAIAVTLGVIYGTKTSEFEIFLDVCQSNHYKLGKMLQYRKFLGFLYSVIATLNVYIERSNHDETMSSFNQM